VSVDRGETPHRLITGEYCNAGDLGRVARWPLDASGKLAPGADGNVHATEAYTLPEHHIQGAVSAGGSWYVSRSAGANAQGRLIVAQPGASPTGKLQVKARRPAGIGPEDLSFWPGRNEVWTVTEHAGKRMLYGVPR
jgi:hypothetical protein